uniref:Putative ovule protein n=1 Tax=Solanum chacoense TaxID=4108 RepID=A0A0V0GQB5_SOLCH
MLFMEFGLSHDLTVVLAPLWWIFTLVPCYLPNSPQSSLSPLYRDLLHLSRGSFENSISTSTR